MMILSIVSWLCPSLLSELGLLLDHPEDHAFSTKDYLALESKYHPSWAIRKLFQYLLSQLKQGKTLGALAQRMGLPLAAHSTDMSDLKPLLLSLGLPHSVEYPWDLLFRLSVLAGFHLYIQDWTWKDPCWLLYSLIAFVIVREQFAWTHYKIRLTLLHCWQGDLLVQMHFVQGCPMPLFVQTPWEKKVWIQIFQMNRGIEHSRTLFVIYWKQYYLRQAVLHRKMLQTILQLIILILFISTITPILSGFYQGQFLS